MEDKLANIKVPTLVAWGKQDKLLPISAGERYTSGIAGAKMVSFDKCGHVPAIEKTDEFVTAVAGFLGGGAAPAK
jgi:pimeloyl-ACP methyl ester carboxylesterase